MHRRSLALAGALVLLVAHAAPAAPHRDARVRTASATLLECRAGLAVSDRTATFRGDMRMVRRAGRMQMRFVLQTAPAGGGGWRKLKAAGFGTWTTAHLGVARYVHVRRVDGLAAGARYRATVTFRWLSATGRVVRVSRSRTPACEQPDLRPNLLADVITVAEAGAGRARYTVPLRNTGRTAAGSFEVVLTVNGERRPAEAVAGLAPGERRLIGLMGPRCIPGTEITVELDTARTVDERDEADNLVSLSCA